MPVRPSFANRDSTGSTARPISAIYLGPTATTPSTPSKLPDLPEPPPSPGAESNSSGHGSGLPSPPATNSSESTGDDTTNFGSVRQRPASYSHSSSSANMNGSSYNTEHSSRSMQNLNEGDDDLDDENDIDNNDEDNTARLERRRSLKSPNNENLLALQRVKSLTQRNRMVSCYVSIISHFFSSASNTCCLISFVHHPCRLSINYLLYPALVAPRLLPLLDARQYHRPLQQVLLHQALHLPLPIHAYPPILIPNLRLYLSPNLDIMMNSNQ